MALVKPPCFLCHATSQDLQYYKFPVNRELRDAWTAAIGAAGSAVCSAHFADDDYCHMRGRRRLRASAVPSVRLAQKSPPPIVEDESKPEDPEKTETVQDQDNKQDGAKSKKTKRGKSKKPKSSSYRNAPETSKSAVDVPKEVEKRTDNKKDDICIKENGNINAENGHEEKDIEDMITNYQIKQTKALADRLNKEPLEDLSATSVPGQSTGPDKSDGKSALPLHPNTVAQHANRSDSQLADRLANRSAKVDGVVEIEPEVVGVDAEPVFIEVSVEKGSSRAASPQDCLMLLESVQCEVDPASLMLPEHAPETDSDMEIVDVKKEDDPISLLTSSDEDEVIIQEPHIDTVDVSDETDEDDRPLQRFVRPKPPPVPKKPMWLDGLAKSLMPRLQYHWGVYQYYCEICNYRTESDAEIKQHMIESEHPTIPLQVCQTCNFSTGSKAQFARHRRKHKDERNYKCHLCHYKARHKMSLIYHLKSHQPKERNPAFVCDKCGFSTDVKREGLKHIKACIDLLVFSCDLCNYSTKRRSDLKRHRQRRHSIDDDDDTDFTA